MSERFELEGIIPNRTMKGQKLFVGEGAAELHRIKAKEPSDYGQRWGIITVAPIWRGGDIRDLRNPKFLLKHLFFLNSAIYSEKNYKEKNHEQCRLLISTH